ncbi:hypothetical protein [Kitasatospora sp. NPDC088783]|uniref:hypothetical protein n=1 Tax=Kitasatospora sp. NPDC088783 TaxID=3364077 RepID=UPI00381CD451
MTARTGILARAHLQLARLIARRPRARNVMVAVIGLLAAAGALAPLAAADSGDYKPSGIGDLMPSPVKPNGGQSTLFESYDSSAYTLDKQLSDTGDITDNALYSICQLLMSVLTLIGRAAVVLIQWVFRVVSLPEIEQPLAAAIKASAGPMAEIFLPTALAVGAFIAWAKRSESSPLGQLAWVVASATIAVTFFTAPATWIKGVDNGRQLGASVAMTTTGSGLSSTSDAAMPFQLPEPTWTADDRDNTLRRASDAVWRTYVAGPWCIADLGSIKACQRWGKQVLDKGTDMDKREDFLSSTLNADTVGRDAVNWRQGHTPSGRIGVLIMAIICCVVFSAMLIMLAFTTLASLLGALLLLVCGVAFASMWCIPGKPRAWGVAWFEMLLGMVMASFTATMLLGAVLVVQVATLGLLPVYGWLVVSALNIATGAMAFKIRGRLEGIVSSGGAQMTGRSVLSTVGRLAGARMMRNAIRGGGAGPRRSAAPAAGGTAAGAVAGAVAGAAGRMRRAREFPPPPSDARTTGTAAGPGTGPAPAGGSTRPAASTGPATGASSRPGGSRIGGPGSGPGRRAAGSGSRATGASTGGPGARSYGVRPGGPAATGAAGTGRAYGFRPGGPGPSAPGPAGSRASGSSSTGSRTIPGVVESSITVNRYRSYPPPRPRPGSGARGGTSAPRTSGPSLPRGGTGR